MTDDVLHRIDVAVAAHEQAADQWRAASLLRPGMAVYPPPQLRPRQPRRAVAVPDTSGMSDHLRCGPAEPPVWKPGGPVTAPPSGREQAPPWIDQVDEWSVDTPPQEQTADRRHTLPWWRRPLRPGWWAEQLAAARRRVDREAVATAMVVLMALWAPVGLLLFFAFSAAEMFTAAAVCGITCFVDLILMFGLASAADE